MSNELIPASASDVASADAESKALMVAKNVDYLPRIQVFSGKNKAVLEGKIPMGHFGLVEGDNITDLGASCDVLIIASRAKAMKLADQILTYFDPESPEFQNIVDMSGEEDSGCMYGPEFLVYLPNEGFATFFFSNKTLRRVAKSMQSRLRKAATMEVGLIKGRTYTWHGITAINDCSSFSDIPDFALIEREKIKFINEKSSVVTEVSESAPKRER